MEESNQVREGVKMQGVDGVADTPSYSASSASMTTASASASTTSTSAPGAAAPITAAPVEGRPRLPVMPATTASIRTTSGMMTPSSTPLGHVNAARRPGPLPARGSQSSGLSQDIQEKMKAFSLSRQGAPGNGSNGNERLPGIPIAAPQATSPWSPPSVQGGAAAAPMGRTPTPKMGGGGLAAKRGMAGGMKLSNVTGQPPGAAPGIPNASSGANGSPANLPKASGTPQSSNTPVSAFSKYSELIDTKAGTINFKNKAIIHGGGIDFSSGQSFSISLDDVESLNELGKGNYGTVYRVRHCRPKIRRPGLGLKGSMAVGNLPDSNTNNNGQNNNDSNSLDTTSNTIKSKGDLTNVIMAMKEIRLELDEAKFTAIIMELDILHRCISPFIIDFYGAFFQEGAVYICVEFMDGGSMEKVYAGGVPENILRKITLSTVMGLKCLKDEHNIIHRDVKPTNILVNTRGQIKICDFGVSGNLVASIAKTNIGCQSYMAPERIAGGGHPGSSGGGTYSVQSDIWSLGLTIVECAMGRYPYPPETYNNIFSQLNAIVQGDPPTLPDPGFSPEAKDFVASCLQKNPAARPTYANLIRHAWVEKLMQPPTATPEASEAAETAGSEEPTDTRSPDVPDHNTDTYDKEVAAWVIEALKRRAGEANGRERPALHAVALDAVPKSPLLEGQS
ncbi:STE/STE7 protein kinase [Trichophyton rubrum D6]|uniref:mitogen-activated protein kinase kinase n=4 Tax=Trichophyton TaxID=5550 RepID=A0A178F7Q9_TRIRU|nr:STE/STE7 protein kinase [Trichophyton rubrum CBS 118892]EZF27524.1 STE/STE7 protein kinase [Trichophyton rubrum MR850]EZF46570.1 STE/STE7 protein kinase [Trichophyton rubrum CBS 100081]EZF57213.1 STE/STE7 protein kinase [Trichophyton rubrum CBS 288.86]EZF67818.1 STE/STE7 protein kinase [Trichophyton rubrum CBS 289.86]EZF78522.1 STE/STE7 protein kinase [Trichophyton soudanense CBS 452.61]EZF89159.1 STE/STE7 protein kinase [Trichophyton rubrum MR1448]EZG00016.1 STE/STE7 protein kinase [Tric